MYKHGHELPEFAMYPLLDDRRAVADLTAMYTRYLEVAADHDFFVGHRGTLVHDNTIPRLRLDPFDAEPSLSTLAR